MVQAYLDFAIQLMDYWAVLIALPLVALYLFFGLDDVLVDLVAWIREERPEELSPWELHQMIDKKEKRIAIMVASWKEKGVISRMVRGNRSNIQYRNYDFFLGVYPNDDGTVREAMELAQQFSNVHVVVNFKPGPTSKGQMINEIVRNIVSREQSEKIIYEALLMHDSEDLIHPYALKLINFYLDFYDFIQVPVFSLPVSKKSLVAGTYIDEFSEMHTKDVLVRNFMVGAIPSAGVGTALSRRLVEIYLSHQGGSLLNQKSLTEDYELGVSADDFGLYSKFACHYYRRADGRKEFIATREYFPKSFTRSVKQKSRWTLGIAFQGTEHLGWKGSWARKYFLYRDRKGPFCNFIAAVGTLLYAYSLARLPFNPMLFNAAPYPELLLLGFTTNAAFMTNRILQRSICVFRIYGLWHALLAPLRLPIANVINALASCKAVQQYIQSKVSGATLKWTKTEHELPEGFGSEATAVGVVGPGVGLKTPATAAAAPQRLSA